MISGHPIVKVHYSMGFSESHFTEKHEYSQIPEGFWIPFGHIANSVPIFFQQEKTTEGRCLDKKLNTTVQDVIADSLLILNFVLETMLARYLLLRRHI